MRDNSRFAGFLRGFSLLVRVLSADSPDFNYKKASGTPLVNILLIFKRRLFEFRKRNFRFMTEIIFPGRASDLTCKCGKDMKQIELIEKFNFGEPFSDGPEKQVREIYDGARRRMIKVKLSGGAVLTKHKAVEPISVLCLAGRGVFTAGAELEEKIDLSAGVLITLGAGVEHEVVAAPEIYLLVTKFKDL